MLPRRLDRYAITIRLQLAGAWCRWRGHDVHQLGGKVYCARGGKQCDALRPR